MSTDTQSARLAWTLVDRFAGHAATSEFYRLSHDRLMEESQRRLAHAALDEELAATRVLGDARTYRLWEDEHSTLMRRISVERLPNTQKSELLTIALALIHRKALFEYLRDDQVRGVQRQQIIGHFCTHRDYASAIVAEHGRYLRSAASFVCSSHVGSNVMFDTLFESPLAEYEEVYARYFRAYCHTAVTNDLTARSMLPILAELKAEVGQWRKALVQLTHSQSGIWRRPKF
jgi:hypothetical protein